MRNLVAIVFYLALTGLSLAEGAADLARNAQSLHQFGMSLEGPARTSVLADVRRILDRVLVEHPTSREAATIRARGRLGGLDLATLYDPSPSPAQDLPPGTGFLSGGPSQGTAGAVDPKERLKAVQAALNDRGCKAGAPDGVAGRKTTRGYEAFLREKGLKKGEYTIDSEAFWSVLQGSSGTVCETMPAVPVTMATIKGNWAFTLKCGRKTRHPGLKVSGVFSVQPAGGNRWTGRFSRSDGARGRWTGKLAGRKLTFLSGSRVDGFGIVAEDAYVMHGRGSNGCGFSARKR
ncbi:MAG: hypothetical protein OIF48_17785 [Silicimonas sp.]|nr:hypothetical protein [Silicimonas sp.]